MAVRRGSIRPDDSTALIQVVTFVHVHLGTRATLLDITQQLVAVADTAPDVLLRAHFVRLVEPRTNVSLLLANVYQYQAGQPLQQAACLSLISSVFARWEEQSDCTVAGGDGTPLSAPELAMPTRSGFVMQTKACETGAPCRALSAVHRRIRLGPVSTTRAGQSLTASCISQGPADHV
jgi:hypothetical protein